MTRFAAVLGVASVLAIGGTSTASAAGDPLHVRVCNYGFGFCAPLADVSVEQVVPAGSLVCSPQNEIVIPQIAVPISVPGVVTYTANVEAAICEQ